jgi:8-oxo-dGTP pyrophosphatase MutT (NUDIX family)
MEHFNPIFDEQFISNKLYDYNSPERLNLRDEFFTPSAVLFSIIPYKNKPYDLIVIHRTNRGLKHRGEMSFPGGKFDSKQDKNIMDTALRETEEEIGVPRDKIKILGCLNDFPTMTKYIITPFVAIIDKNQKLVKQEREVQEIVKIPISFFVSKKNFREQAFNINGAKFPVFYFNYKNPENGKKYTVWGATAYMIATFLEQMYEIKFSKSNLRRFDLEKIRHLKNYIKFKKEITSNFK